MKLSTVITVLALATATQAAHRGHSSSAHRELPSGSGSGDSCADDRTLPDEQPASDCDICALNDVKPRTFYFKYNAGQGSTSDYQTTGPGCKASCSADDFYPASADIVIKDKDGEEIKSISVSDGSTFSFDTSSSEAHIDFHDANLDCFFHTSCSQPMVPGDAFGPFELLPDEFCGPSSPTAAPPCGEECFICGDVDSNGDKNKERPSSLTLEYNPVGQNSDYDQNERDTVCTAGMYPPSTTLTVNGVNIQVSAGTEFTIFPEEGEDRFDADTMFDFSNGDHDSCSIHTSCSKMLVQGDQIGPFIVVGGGDKCPPCEPEGGECVETDSDNYNCGDAITVTFDYSEAGASPLADDWIGIYPCGIEPGCLPEPIVWQYACGDTFGCEDSTGTPPSTGTYVFDSLPATNAGFAYHKWPVTQWIPADSNGELANCFEAYLVRYEAPSPPPYVAVCSSPPFYIGGSVEYSCAPSVGTPGALVGPGGVPSVCRYN